MRPYLLVCGKEGDTVLELEGKTFTGPTDLAKAISGSRPGHLLTVRVRAG
jgi:S1-C subfamily serine protease